MHRHERFDETTTDPRFSPGFPGRGDFAGAPRGRGRGGGRGRGRGDGFGPGYGRHGGFGPGFGPPMHGYQIITELTERSGGVWRPSPGSVYPTLQALEDQGLVTADQTEGRRVF